MKKDIAEFISRCLACQQVKVEHQKTPGLLQPLETPKWKWKHITMDFVARLPPARDNDSIWVIVDRLTKLAHFIPMKMRGSMDILAYKYIDNVVKLHGIPDSIVSDRDMRFVGRFWVSLQAALGTTLSFSTAYHPQIDGQTKRTNQTMEDMLWACVLDFGKD